MWNRIIKRSVCIAVAAILLCRLTIFATVTAFIDPLAWNFQESGTESWCQVFGPADSGEPIQVKDVPFGWDFGVRVGARYQPKCSKWDTQFAYTWFTPEASDSASTAGRIAPAFLGNFFADNPSGAVASENSYHNGSLKWKVHFNMFDWEVGRRCCVCSNLSMRPFIGLKGGWIHQSVHTKWQNPISGAFTHATENLSNNFWGIGPTVGLNTNWTLSRCFAVFADISGALMWGHWTFSDIYRSDEPAKVSVKLAPITGGAAMMRAFVGFQYERACFTARLGYEAQFWLDQLRYYTLNTGRLDNMLTLQGVTLNLNYRF